VKILILGGYGVFGGRLVELLSDLTDIELIVCGRSLTKAQAYCAAYRSANHLVNHLAKKGHASIRPLQLDRKDTAKALKVEQPQVVVDASGPFQGYGDDCYSVIKACIAERVNYLDFADAADFVFGVSRFDEQAKAAGVYILSGVSSFPVLTAAVLREMAKTMDIVSVEGGIAPSPYAGVGLNVMRAVVGYAGSPVTLQRHGEKTQGIGLAESMRYTVAVPGKMPLKNIHFSLVDVPDLQMIPPEHATLTDIWMGAGPVPEILHRILNLLAKARARFKLPSLVPLSRVFYIVLNLMKFGEHRGGMFVHARGIKREEISGKAINEKAINEKTMEQSWHLLAEGDDGPYIPSMAIEAIIRKSLKGEQPQTGARSGANALELSDYDRLLDGREIYTGFRKEEPVNNPKTSPFHHVLGSAFGALPIKVQELHSVTGVNRWSGVADVKRGKGVIAQLICSAIGFPKTATNVPVEVTIQPEANGERWIRNFGGKKFSSLQQRGTKKNEYLLVESFGIFDVGVALVVERDRLYFVPRRWTCIGIPMPKTLLPAGRSYETEKQGQFCFNIEISAPLIGLVVAYEGSLTPN
jgi:hypothetical protein